MFRVGKKHSAAVLLLTSSRLFAGVNTWTSSGPLSVGDNFGVAIDPGNTAIFYAPPWKSTDGGASWQLTSLSSYAVTKVFYSVAAGPSGTVYVGTSCCYPSTLSPGLLKSTDAGVNWTV